MKAEITKSFVAYLNSLPALTALLGAATGRIMHFFPDVEPVLSTDLPGFIVLYDAERKRDGEQDSANVNTVVPGSYAVVCYGLNQEYSKAIGDALEEAVQALQTITTANYRIGQVWLDNGGWDNTRSKSGRLGYLWHVHFGGIKRVTALTGVHWTATFETTALAVLAVTATASKVTVNFNKAPLLSTLTKGNFILQSKTTATHKATATPTTGATALEVDIVPSTALAAGTYTISVTTDVTTQNGLPLAAVSSTVFSITA